jgi:hypothetical protein
MRLNPLNLLKSLFNGASANSTPPAPKHGTNLFLGVPVSETRALPTPANVSPYISQATKATPAARPGKSGLNAVNLLPSGLNLLSDKDSCSKAPLESTYPIRPANSYSYEPIFASPQTVNAGRLPLHSTSTTNTDTDMEDGVPAQEPIPPSTPLPGKCETQTGPSPPIPMVETVEGGLGTPAATTSDSVRPKLQPKGQMKRRTVNRPKHDYAAEITYEEDDGDLPEGYLGTWNRMRFYSPEIDMPCRFDAACGLLHHLSCGHWVATNEKVQCGLNCHTPNFGAAPFNCPTCHQAVQNLIENQLSQKEKARVNQARNVGNETYLIGFLVEFVSKHIKMKANVTETVISIVRECNHERSCNVAVPPNIASRHSLERQVKQYYERKAERKLAMQNPPSSIKRNARLQLVQPVSKKLKSRLATDNMPPLLESRGIKRHSASDDHPAQKIIRTLQLVQSNVSPSSQARDSNRRINPIDFSTQKTTPAAQNGDVRSAAPPVGAVGPLVRKRDADMQIGRERNKRPKRELARIGRIYYQLDENIEGTVADFRRT